MSTNDVPGANPQNADELRAGCWAEHADGSLIYVKGTEGDSVVYELFDTAHSPVLSYTDAMQKDEFKKFFSYPPTGASQEKWTWHDKTPFDWKRVMRITPRPRPDYASAEDLMSAAERVAQSLRLRGREVVEELHRHKTDEEVQQGGAASILRRIGRAIDALAGK